MLLYVEREYRVERLILGVAAVSRGWTPPLCARRGYLAYWTRV